MAFDLVIDNLTVFFLTVFAALLIWHRFFYQPQPLVHPLLLGKQSEVSSVRREGETGVYRSWATGQGTPLTVRPASTLKTVQDVVQAPKGVPSVVPRCILDTSLTDEALQEILRLLPIGLQTLYPTLSTSPTAPTPILTLLPPSPTTSLPLLLLYLSSPPCSPLVVLPSPTLLTTALTATCHPRPGLVVVHASIADDVLEQVLEDCHTSAGVLLVGDERKEKTDVMGSATSRGMTVHWWEEIWDAAEARSSTTPLPDAHFSDVHSYFYNIPKDDAPVAIVKVTHMNVTAGIAALLSLFPADKRPTAALGDVVASAVRLDTPLGMSIALASLWSAAGFRMIGHPTPTWEPTEGGEAAELEQIADTTSGLPKPSILFITSEHHLSLLTELQTSFVAHPLSAFAARHQTQSIRAGHVSRGGLLDRYLFRNVREGMLGGVAGERLRAVIVVGDGPPADSLGMSHLLLSLPLTRLHPSFYATGPIFVSHFYDLQTPASSLQRMVSKVEDAVEERAHVGPPATNIEVILKGEEVHLNREDGYALEGEVFVRGPSVLERIDPASPGTAEGWMDIGEKAKVQTNGTFVMMSPIM
ncbi:hypothetical protein M231_06039 [Tremella mesenterica]|uniref:AMP-dependent synthetase/ligase domain-containing protein n=1 Tax=Tremella mesenterica TaxID=5217 RepID=A0A4Q1BCU0_TREME|nr:uncharacterized protein TREMEDRAFT_72985 [Tremella mesenterica DSM 1558]EIW73123.1 hypothetical protein TREMEDRAFT_72985 [Tremella mesenterica DSM 1558]RXK36652.1 hypothetical protein M231_06039 [Tremella mesenterica]